VTYTNPKDITKEDIEATKALARERNKADQAKPLSEAEEIDIWNELPDQLKTITGRIMEHCDFPPTTPIPVHLVQSIKTELDTLSFLISKLDAEFTAQETGFKP
jgi:hypothetical protein